MRKKINMDIDKFLTEASKWILPFIGAIYIAKLILGFGFSFGFSF
jgi:hypothetical protein